MKLIDKELYFIETKKAISTALQKEKDLLAQMPLEKKLALVQDHLTKTISSDEYDELINQEKEIFRKIRFNQFTEEAIPSEYKNQIKRNVKVEELEAIEKKNELKAELKPHISYIENEVIPLVTAIHELESMGMIPNKLEMLLNANIGEKEPLPISVRTKMFNLSRGEVNAGKGLNSLLQVVNALKQIEVPTQTKGILDFLKRGKK